MIQRREGFHFASKIFLCLCFYFFSGTLLLALNPDHAITQYVLNNWQTEDGLPQNSVRAIVQDHKGYLWLGTQEGLTRFDGVRFTVFDKTNTPKLKHDNILALHEDRSGNLWIGTFNGFHKMKDGVVTAYTAHDGLSNELINAISEDPDGSIWIGTDNGLNKYSGGSFSTYTIKDGLSGNTIHSLYTDETGKVWIGTDNGLDSFQNNKFTHHPVAALVRAIKKDSKGCLWIGTDNGLLRYRDGTIQTYTTSNGLTSNAVYAIYPDSDGNLWIGTYGGGLNRMQGEKFSALVPADGLTSDIVWSIAEDHEGSLWMGTYGGGLERLKNGKFVTVTSKEGLADDNVNGIFEDSARNLWFGTNNGMSRLKDGKFTHYGTKEGLPNKYVLAFAEDSDRNLWIGTEGGGIARLNQNKIVPLGGDVHPNIRCIFPASTGEIWIGTYGGGLTRFVNGNFITYTSQHGLAHNVVHAIAEDTNRQLWIVTNGGISKFKDGKFSNFGPNEGLSANIALSIYIDKEGILWIGTLGGGLNRFANSKFTIYTRANGLHDESVAQILEDAYENLWMTSNKGVFYVSKRELNDYAVGKIKRIQSVSYGLQDGMKSVECNGGSQPAGWKTAQGQLWFPTIRGAVMIQPEAIALNRKKPLVHIETVIADDLQISNIRKNYIQEIPPGKKKIEFQYSGISLIDPQKVLFRYKLEGFDSDWNNPVSRRVAYYTNLPPGQYTFRVLACNNDGLWNEVGAAFAFHLNPRFTQTPLFYLLCALAAVFAAWSIHRMRVRQVRRQVEARFAAVLNERARMGREIHDTLAQGLTGIAIRLEACRQIMPDVSQTVGEYLQSARDLANTSLREARHMIQNLRPHFLLDADLPTALESLTQQLTAGTGIEYTVRVFGTPSHVLETVENELVRICQEAVANAIKHAQPKRIDVELLYNNSQIQLAVRDDGIGIHESSAEFHVRSESVGLISIKERVQLIGGEIKITSSTGQGTQVVVNVPKP